jgi:hypothetical protein
LPSSPPSNPFDGMHVLEAKTCLLAFVTD